MVQTVGVGDAVDGGVQGGEEGEDVGYEACSVFSVSLGGSL